MFNGRFLLIGLIRLFDSKLLKRSISCTLLFPVYYSNIQQILPQTNLMKAHINIPLASNHSRH